MSFSKFVAAGHSYVIPADAQRLVAEGRLDRRLFDLTTLLEFGYDDARRDTVPLIVTHPAGRAAPRIAGAAGTRALPSINGTALAVDKSGAAWGVLTGDTAGTLAAGVSRVWLDGQRKSTLDRSAAQIGAPAAWDAGLTGEGVTVAVLDTGVDQTHPDLADREVAEQNFTDAEDNVDRAGHGTHVASIVAGTGAKSGGKYRGIAPGASILDGKVLNDFGFGLDSWIIAGMEWAAQQGADVANLSLGGSDTTDVDPIEQAVGALTARYGTLFVIAAGNSGPGAHTVGSPGSAPEALTVGAVERTDELAGFSSRGPTEQDGVIKPEITAPGVGIVAALHSAGTISPPVEPGYTALTGTSMAAPHVAGAVALLAGQRPDLTAAQLKAVLAASAAPVPDAGVFEQGAGRVDVAHALDQTIVTDPPVVHAGTVAWPHDDDEPVSRAVTYRNLGDADVTLDLTVEATGPDGAPADVFSVSTDRVTVPAGGEAKVTVTGDTGRGTLDGHYSGTITAASGDAVTRTPVAVTREVESYDLTLNHNDEHGAPTADYNTVLINLDSDRWVFPYDADGSETVRMPKGRYLADHVVFTEQGEHVNWIQRPSLVLDRDRTIDVDPRVTRPVSVTPPVAATMEFGELGYQMTSDTFLFAHGQLVEDLGTVSTARIDDGPSDADLAAWLNTGWTGTDGDFYGLAWFFDQFPTGVTRTVHGRELATVRTTLGDGGIAGSAAEHGWTPQPLSRSTLIFAPGAVVPQLPVTRTAHLLTSDVRWGSTLFQLTAEGDVAASLQSAQQVYRPGRTYREELNHPVFGPALPAGDIDWAVRDPGGIFVDVPMFSDGEGNAGYSRTEGANTKLFVGEELVGEYPDYAFGYFTGLPAESRTYRLTTEARRPAPFTFTTAISAEWTFTSSAVEQVESIPLNVVRFQPKLDENGTARAGRPFLVPLRLQDETGATTRPARLTVEVSYDDGASWRRAPVLWGRVALLDHPAGATSVSLRASATDQEGNTVKQTVLRAYLLR